VQAVDERTIERATDGASGGSWSYRRSDEWCKRWNIVLQKERWLLQAIDQRAKLPILRN